MNSLAVSGRSIALAGKAISKKDRVLITGASGWFGQTATTIMDVLGIQTLLIGSHSRTLQIAGKIKKIEIWNKEKIIDFSPTVIVDCAYLTREFVDDVGLSEFVEVNRQLGQKIIDLKDLESLRLVVAFSSGAAEIYRLNRETTTIENDPYGFLKYEQEELLKAEFSSTKSDLVIARVWSTSGSLVSKVNGFAFSDLIHQALCGEIRVNSNFYVWRRYSMIEEIIAVALNGSQGKVKWFDTGGTLIEIRDLARTITEIVNAKAKLILPENIFEPPSNYYSDGSSWENWCKSLVFSPKTIEEQISQVAKWMQK